jgi:hypothetical protein
MRVAAGTRSSSIVPRTRSRSSTRFQAYVIKVQQRCDELVKEDWALPVYRSVVLEDAAKVTF